MFRISLCLTWLLLGVAVSELAVDCESFKNLEGEEYTCDPNRNPIHIPSKLPYMVFRVSEKKEKKSQRETTYLAYVVEMKKDKDDKTTSDNLMLLYVGLNLPEPLFYHNRKVKDLAQLFCFVKVPDGNNLRDLMATQKQLFKDRVWVTALFQKIYSEIYKLYHETTTLSMISPSAKVSKSTVYTDLNLFNIFVDKECGVTLRESDFSLLKDSPGDWRGTPGFMAPEVYDSAPTFKWTDKQDVYSLGVVYFAMLLEGNLPSESKDPEILAKAEKILDPFAFNLLKGSLEKERSKRISLDSLGEQIRLIISSRFEVVVDEKVSENSKSLTEFITSIKPKEEIKRYKEYDCAKEIDERNKSDLKRAAEIYEANKKANENMQKQPSKKKNRNLLSEVPLPKHNPHSSLTQALGLLLVGLLVLTAVLGAACRVRRSKPELLGTVPSISTELPAH